MRLPDGRGDSSDTQFRRAEQNSLQAFCKRFSGPIGTFLSDRGGADAWQITTCGHGVLQTSPHGRALDPENQVRILEGQLDRLVRRGCDVRSLYRSTCLKKSLNSALNRSASSTN